MEVHYNDRTAFLKLFLGANAPKRWEATRARLRQAGEVMSGENQAVRTLVEVADCHALIMSTAPGRPMQEVFLETEPTRRLAIVRRAGEWLECLIPAREQKPFQAWKGYLRLVKFASAYTSDETFDRQLVRVHMAQMERITRQLHLQPIEWGVSHGDFHPENIFIAEEGNRLTVTGIDMEIADPIPVVQDLARMLVWLECYNSPGQTCESGINQALFESLCACHGPFAASDRLALHFHIGEMLLEFYLRRSARLPDLRPRVKQALKHWATHDLHGVIPD